MPAELDDLAWVTTQIVAQNPQASILVLDWPYWMEIIESIEVARENYDTTVGMWPEESRDHIERYIHTACWFLGDRGLDIKSDPLTLKLLWE